MVKRGQYYQWPSKDDISTELQSSIVQYLSQPRLVEGKSSKRNQKFSFREVIKE